jgi:hypothetical protein
MNVLERQAMLVLVDDLGRDLPVDDPLKYRFLGHCRTLRGCYESIDAGRL